MSFRTFGARRRRGGRALVAPTTAAVATIAILLGASLAPSRASHAIGEAHAGAAEEVTPQTDAAAPAHELLMLGASPAEAADETWAIGKIGAQSRATWAVLHYVAGTGWTLAPPILDGSGNPLSGFVPSQSPLTGSITANGSGALLGSVPSGGQRQEVLLVRAPGGSYTQTSGEPTLKEGEDLFEPGGRRAPLVAALEEGPGSAGALVVPVSTKSAAAETSVLHWSGSAHTWTSEPIEIPQSSVEAGGFRVLALAASSAGNAWLLAQLQAESDSVALFHREEGPHGAVWQLVSPTPLQVPLAGGVSTPLHESGTGEPPSGNAQLLTVSSQGVWIDGERADTLTPTTIFFKPTAADEGEAPASWCPGNAVAPCTHVLEEPLPTGASRSFAWANPSTPFGERVITGLGEGVSLRLEDENFARVLALGSAANVDVGGSHGAAFSSAREGWLGSARLPVHLTLDPEEDLLQNYPVPFRRPLLAIAPQPGVPVGALESGALAVGEDGEVARYSAGVGWQPESLLNVAGVRQTPHLRAVAWPTAGRAYAVGSEGQMWLWRKETDLWEKDPATPIDFRGDLLGIAFNPESTSTGYAVGQGGVLLRYGKTWTQEPTCAEGVPEPCLPAEVAGASFTSIAFAGAEALVAYRVPHFMFNGEGSSFFYTGGVLANSGSGWHVDEAVAAALASETQDIPWAVAGLPDGGAALSAESAAGVPRILERNSPAAPWEATAQPYPGFSAPGSLALFREGGALRVIGAGVEPHTNSSDEQRPPPAGFPPALIRPYPLGEPPAFLLRQTAAGWSDQEHDHDEVGPPEGSYKQYDKGYEPDPSWVALVGPTGSSGWTLGGFPKGEEQGSGFETADIARYSYPRAESTMPPGLGRPAVPVASGTTAFAVGGGSQCGAPCAARANAHLGPDTWLSDALKQAHSIEGVQAFLYTGPRLTTGAALVKATLEIPYGQEFTRYAELLEGGGGGYAYAAPSPTDRVGESECLFTERFSFPFTSASSCASGGSAYYAFTKGTAKSPVRVVVIDDSSAVDPQQLEWLTAQLAAASAVLEPAIVVGSADLNRQAEHAEGNAAETINRIVAGKAAAYFFDAPEQNLRLLLPHSAIPAYGSGTLGYVSVQSSELPDFIGASGFLLAEVGKYEAAAAGRGNAAVTAELIPNIAEGEHGGGELALEGQQGTLLRRSQVAAFVGLARRPRAGNTAFGESESERFSYTFTPIPANCVGADCAAGIPPEYSFTSSDEEIGRFVKPELNSAEPNAVKFNEKTQEPEFEGGQKVSSGAPYESKSGLFCALNAGTTTVTISAGGFAASLPVTVQAGSVRRPCGTTPVKRPAAKEQAAAPPPPPPPAPSGAPASAPPLGVVPVPPPPVSVVPITRPPQAPHEPPTPFFVQPTLPFILAPFVPPPLPAPANPTPPSGTSAVTSPVEAAQKEEEEEEATESVSNQAVAYRAPEHEPSPTYLLGIVLLAAFAGAAGVKRRPRRSEREVRVAPATISTVRSQRRMGGSR